MRPQLRAGSAALLLLGLLATTAPLQAAPTTLDETLRQVYETNPRLQAERARLRATDEQVPQALAGWRPTARYLGGYGLENENEDFKSQRLGADQTRHLKDSDTLYQLNNRLTIQQPIYSGGETVADTSRAENTVRAGRARLAGAQQDLLSATVEAYAAVVRARRVLAITFENRDRLSRYQDATRERLRLQEVTRTDVDQVQSRVAGSAADIARSEAELAAALSQYEQVVGETPGELVPARPRTDLPGTIDEAIAASRDNPRIAQSTFELEAARDQVRVAEAGLLPDVNLIGEANHQQQPSDNIDSRLTYSMRAELVVPLYQRGTEYSRVRQAKQTMIQARYVLDDTERLVKREVLRSFAAWQSARSQIESLQIQSDAAVRALEGTREEAIAGNRTTLDVLNAELELFSSQVRLERAQEAAVTASYDLKAALGGLDPDGLQIDAPRYDPEANYRDVRGRWFGLSVDTPPDLKPLPPR